MRMNRPEKRKLANQIDMKFIMPGGGSERVGLGWGMLG
jgi:hypothetical protein